MSFASEFRKKYFLDPLKFVKRDAGGEPAQPVRDDEPAAVEPDGDVVAAERIEDAGAVGESVEAAQSEPPAPPDAGPVPEPTELPDAEETGVDPSPAEDDPDHVYQHEVIASRPDVGPAETRTNVHHVLGGMLIAAALMAVLHSGALATYARGLPYGKVYERIIMAAEVWHGYMEDVGLTAVMTTTRDWVTAVRESRWPDIAGLVGLEEAPDLDEAAVPLDESADVTSELPAPDAGSGAIDDVDGAQPDAAILPDGGSLPPAVQGEGDR